MDITECILELREEYLNSGEVTTYREINSGLCEEFALEALARVTAGKANLYEACGENFLDEEGDGWDFSLLKSFWGITPPKTTTRKILNAIPFGGHVFIADPVAKRFYDSECPEGVASFFDLPFYQRCIHSYKNGLIKQPVSLNGCRG